MTYLVPRKSDSACNILSHPLTAAKLLIFGLTFPLALQTLAATENPQSDNKNSSLVATQTSTQISAVTTNSLGDLFVSVHSASIETDANNKEAGIKQSSMSQVGTIRSALLNDARSQQLAIDQGKPETDFSVIKLLPDTGQLSAASTSKATLSALFTGNLHASALRYMPLSESPLPSDKHTDNSLTQSDNHSSDYRGALYIAANEFEKRSSQDTANGTYAQKASAGLTDLHRITLDNIAGNWQINEKHSMELDLTPIDGLFNASELLTSPWETLLAVESISVESAGFWNAPENTMANHKYAHIRASAESVNQYLNRESNPYRYGYVVEMIDQPLRNANAELEIQRHYATGRLPAGKSLISSDGKTLYRVAAKSGILFRFTADFPNNLAAGTLSVGRFIPIQPDAHNPYIFAAFNLEWIDLGRGNNEEIAGWIADYEGMTAYDFSENQTSYLTDDDITAWYDKHKRRHLNDNGDIGQYIDSRVAFLEPIKAAAALGADRQAIKVRDITLTDNHIVLKVAADNFRECGELFAGAPDIEGDLNHIERIELEAVMPQTSLCGDRFVLSQNERFLPTPGMVYMTNGTSISRARLPLFNQ